LTEFHEPKRASAAEPTTDVLAVECGGTGTELAHVPKKLSDFFDENMRQYNKLAL